MFTIELTRKKRILLIFLFIMLTFFFGTIFSLAYSEKEIPKQFQIPAVGLSNELNQLRQISMDFQDADLKDVLKVFSQQAGLNFIAAENVKDRKVTLYLNKVSIDDALNTLLTANNLNYERQENSNIFIVKEWGKPDVETITKVYGLQYATVQGYELTEEGKKKVTQKTIGLRDILEKLLSKYGRITEDSRTNSVVISDVPSQFPQIEKAIKELDVKLPQVMIEVEVLETTLDAINKIGIEWGSSTEGALLSSAGSSRTSTFPFSEFRTVGPEGAVDGLYLGYVSALNLGGTLAMLNKDTNTKILARPRILTINNKTAEIKIASDTAVASLQKIVGGADGIGTQTSEAERVQTGIELKVTPQINKLREITMILEPSVTNTKWSQYFAGSYVDPQTRSAKTTVSVKDGQTVIIGGLINTEDVKTLRKVPFLGNIPFLGNVFRKQDDSSTDKELVIFITPHIVEASQQPQGFAFEKNFLGGGGLSWEQDRFGIKDEAIDEMLDKLEN